MKIYHWHSTIMKIEQTHNFYFLIYFCIIIMSIFSSVYLSNQNLVTYGPHSPHKPAVPSPDNILKNNSRLKTHYIFTLLHLAALHKSPYSSSSYHHKPPTTQVTAQMTKKINHPNSLLTSYVPFCS